MSVQIRTAKCCMTCKFWDGIEDIGICVRDWRWTCPDQVCDEWESGTGDEINREYERLFNIAKRIGAVRFIKEIDAVGTWLSIEAAYIVTLELGEKHEEADMSALWGE